MATTHSRFPIRPRNLAQRKADENATSKHVRQPSNGGGASRFTHGTLNGVKPGQTIQAGRVALSEVTTTAINRKDSISKFGGKDDTGLKKNWSITGTAAQRVPLGRGQIVPPLANTVNARAPIRAQRPSRVVAARHSTITVAVDEDELEEAECAMEVEQPEALHPITEADTSIVCVQEVEDMVIVEEEPEQEITEETARLAIPKPARQWPDVSTDIRVRAEQQIEQIRQGFVDEVDHDATMVSEYAEEIFQYMSELEEEIMPGSDYMDSQQELTWEMRQTLVDWLLQVHLRCHMLPETLWIAVNIIDRFLSKRVVSLVKLQLVGVTAMFIAAKYEEVVAPSVDEFVFLTENGYTREEILKGERIILQVLNFRVSHYCSPYSWMRKISKADDYDIQTRTLSKFLTEVTLLDHRFLKAKPSLVAAVGMYSARKMLGGDWSPAFVYYSGFTEEQLKPGHDILVEKLSEHEFSRQYVSKKYAQKKFLKASVFAIQWARSNLGL